jgi:predicted 2-oxoglutarate/Fe(II)-dependent dioxygenase YbiX
MTQLAAPNLILADTGEVPDFAPAPDAPCFCQSGKSFSECCGSSAPDRPPPFGVFVYEDYLDTSLTRSLVEYAESQPGQRLLVINQEASTADNVVKVEDERRVAERVSLGDRRVQMNELVRTTFCDLALRCTGQTLDWFEAPDLMRYHAGGFYVKHADSQNPQPATRTWKKVIDRDLSLLIYLNDDFEGGGLKFEKFNYRLRPRAGMVVMFPSDSRYVHTAEIVTHGVRYAVVSWASVRGIPKISSQPPPAAILVE